MRAGRDKRAIPGARVVTRDGPIGAIDSRAGDESDPTRVAVRLDDGATVLVAADVLVRQDDGSYLLPLGEEELRSLRGEAIGDALIVPVVREELDVKKRWVDTGKVRVTKVVREREEVVDEPIFREEVEVERVPVGRVVDGPVSTRQEGDVTVVPVLEERLVVEKRLFLTEEIHIRKRRIQESHPQTVVLRGEEVTVDREGGPSP